LVSDTRGNFPKFVDYISFSQKLPVSDARHFQSTANQESVIQMLKEHNIKGKIENKRQIVIKVKPYNCPACGDKKDSNNLRILGDKVYCYDDGCQGI